MKKSMSEKIAVRLVAVGLVAMALTTLLCMVMFHSVFEKQVVRDLQLTAKDIALACERMEDPEDLGSFGGGELRITLIAPDGTVLFENQSSAPMENHLDRTEVRQALESGEGSDQRMSETLGYDTYYYAIRLSNGNVLRVATEAKNFFSIYDDAVPAVLVSCVLILLLSVLLAFFLTRQLVRPIVTMANNLDDVEKNVPYKELEPFAKAIALDQKNRQNGEKIRRDFTANVSHELKTPLTSISGYAELIETGMAKPEDIAGFAARIRKEAGRLMALVGDIIQLSELDDASEEGAGKLTMEPVDLAAVVNECVQDLQPAARKAYLVLSAQTEPVMVEGSRGLLMELCQNLCDNAIRYNRPGGKVEVTVRNVAGAAELCVKDNGIGIAPEHQQRVFERFYRVDKSRSKATGGTGLGLAIVKHIAILHNAKIELESEAGKGTSIQVIFPEQN